MIPDVISGASAGSIVGAFYADGYQPEEISEIFESTNFYKLIGVNVTPLEKDPKLKGIRNVAIRSFHISIARSVHEKKEIFDLYIEPEELQNYGYFNIKNGQELFNIGYNAAVIALSS